MVETRDAMTAEQLLGYEVPGRRVELVRGRLQVREPAGMRHGALGMQVALALMDHLRGERERDGRTRGRVLSADTGFLVARDPDTVRAPDVAYVSIERWSGTLPDGFGDGAPDLAVEVRSPSDRPGAVWSKVGDWLSAGTSLVWVIDPPNESATVCRADGSVTVLGAGDALNGEALLPGFSLPLATLFAGA